MNQQSIMMLNIFLIACSVGSCLIILLEVGKAVFGIRKICIERNRLKVENEQLHEKLNQKQLVLNRVCKQYTELKNEVSCKSTVNTWNQQCVIDDLSRENEVLRKRIEHDEIVFEKLKRGAF